jgi:hypothetical protein
MNKKLFLGMFAAAGMLLATSCSNDELDVVQSGNEAQVTFSLGLEGGIETRAISDGTGAKKLVYAVYKLNAQGNPELQNVVGSDEKGQFVKPDFKSGDNVSINLAKGQTYQVAFWAQNPNCEAYNTDDLTAVSVDYDAAVNNDELRDAFFKTEEFTVSGNKTIDVVLKRPFAQINVGVTQEDWDAAVASGITIAQSSVVIKNAADKINLLTGAVQGDAEVTYTLNGIPAEELKVDADGDGTKEAYHWLSMSYILVNDTHGADEDQDGTLGDYRTTLNSLQYTFKPENGNSIAFAEGLNNVPVQRNWRTNILGKILTGDIQFNITIDPVYDGDIIYPDGSAQELEFAATFGGTVTLKENVTLTEPLTVGADMVLNIEEGKSLTGSLNLLEGAHLTVNGGAINNEDETTSGIVSNGNLTLNDVEITSARHALRIESGNVVIYGGTYKVAPTSSKTLYALNVGDDGTVANVIIKGGTFIGPNGTIADSGSAVGVKAESSVTIEGGNFSGDKNNTLSSKGTLNVVGGTFDQDPTNWVATGYKVLPSGSNFVVVSNDIDAVVSNKAELTDAIASGNANIVLAEDITFGTSEAVDAINKDAFINLNNNTFEATWSFKLGNNADLTMIGGDYFAKGSFGHVDVRPTTAEGSVVTFEDVNFSYNNGSSTNPMQTVVEVCAQVAGAHTKILFKNCTFDNAAVLFEGLSDKTGTFDAVFENCTFNALTSRAPVSVTNFVHGTIKMTGCTFNLKCTSSSASAIDITFNPTTSVTVTAENNTINAVAATTGVDNIKFIRSYDNTTVYETGTVKTGIAQ